MFLTYLRIERFKLEITGKLLLHPGFEPGTAASLRRPSHWHVSAIISIRGPYKDGALTPELVEHFPVKIG